ncbi:MAG: hypothetical protein R3E96_08380 [Planctomycetota bacterium]
MVRKRIQQVRASRFARDSGVLQAGSLMLALLGLAGVLALSHILGAERQAEFYLASAVFGALWFALNLGVAAVATSRVAQASKAGELGEVRDWMTFAVEATLLMGILCAVITLVPRAGPVALVVRFPFGPHRRCGVSGRIARAGTAGRIAATGGYGRPARHAPSRIADAP